jgi:hypothetical protein
MKKILIEVSAGELVDKMTILEIKLQKIKVSESRIEIKKELDSLKKSFKSIEENKNINIHFNKLKNVNLKLWDIENEKRLCEKNSDFKDNFVKLSRDVHFLNDERAKIKLQINESLGSQIKEIKEYTKY